MNSKIGYLQSSANCRPYGVHLRRPIYLGADREGAAFLNVDNPALMELVETMVQAHIEHLS